MPSDFGWSRDSLFCNGLNGESAVMFFRILMFPVVFVCTTLVGCDKSNDNQPASNAGDLPVDNEVSTEQHPPVAAAETGEGGDVLTRLGITLQVEHPFVTESEVRTAFDRAYQVLGGANPAIVNSDWKVVVADKPDIFSATTEMHPEFRSGRMEIAAPLQRYAGAHEAAHFLMGEVTWNSWLPGYIMEFIAAQAEDEQPPGVEQESYEVLNRGILRLPFSTASKNVAGREGAIGVGGSGAYDGLRYGLLRAMSDKIGKENARKLAVEVYNLAAKNRRFTGVSELQPLFARYGVGDCVLFSPGDKPGVYGDFFFNTRGVPTIVYKQIDDRGGENSFQSNLEIAYQKDGKSAYTLPIQTNPMGITSDDGGAVIAHWADGVQVTMSGKTVAYTFANTDGIYTATRVKQKK